MENYSLLESTLNNIKNLDLFSIFTKLVNLGLSFAMVFGLFLIVLIILSLPLIIFLVACGVVVYLLKWIKSLAVGRGNESKEFIKSF